MYGVALLTGQAGALENARKELKNLSLDAPESEYGKYNGISSD